jgi:hypothetical protein
MNSGGYQSDTAFISEEVLLRINPKQISSSMMFKSGKNFYSLINRQLITTKDIRLKPRKPIPASYTFEHILNLPKTFLQIDQHITYLLRTLIGNEFKVTMMSDGKVYLDGTFTDINEELNFNIYPYMAKFPVEYITSPPV